MANELHLKLLSLGAKTWNEWRSENQDQSPDLSSLDLTGMDLQGYDLSCSNLIKSNLTCANLQDTNLSQALLNHSILSKSNLCGADLSSANLSDVIAEHTKMNEAKLKNAYLSRSNFSFSEFYRVTATYIECRDTIFHGARFYHLHLSDSDLAKSSLEAATFIECELKRVNLTESNLNMTTFIRSALIDLNIDSTFFCFTSLIDSIINGLINSEKMYPLNEIYIDSNTIDKSIHLPQKIINYSSFKKHSTTDEIDIDLSGTDIFISYSQIDHIFVTKLVDDLKKLGANCWHGANDLNAGDNLRETIKDVINNCNYFLLVISNNSISSNWVSYEIKLAHEVKTRKEKSRLIVPISIVKQEDLKNWEVIITQSGKNLAYDIKESYIEDFHEWQNDAKYKISLQKLTNSLTP